MSTPTTPTRVAIPRKDESCCSYKICGTKILYKRASLLLIGLSALFLDKEIQNYIYIPLVIFVCAYVIFWNFPVLILFTNSRPLYYEDLFIADWNVKLLDINDVVRKRFETRFQCILIFSNSIFCAALADYWLYELLDKQDYSYVGLLGITGGIVKIFQFINHCSGSILLACTRRALIKNSKKRALENPERIKHNIEYEDDTGFELTSVLHNGKNDKVVIAVKDISVSKPNTPTRRKINSFSKE